jgi:hypothetical protein
MRTRQRSARPPQPVAVNRYEASRRPCNYPIRASYYGGFLFSLAGLDLCVGPPIRLGMPARPVLNRFMAEE